MAKDFRSSIREIAATFAEQFADQIIQLVQTASMAEVFGKPATGGAATAAAPVKSAPPQRRAKRGRRAAAADTNTLPAIIELLKKSSEGMRSEQLRDALSIDKATATKALTAGLADKSITKKGTRRATRYFAR